MRVYVLMGNDYPAAALTDKEEAEALAARLNEEDRAEAAKQNRGRIYWRIYDFKMNAAPGEPQ